ncbi:MAG TPA: L,D-transpeptidase family protein [Ilumatobacteraceae bacterium]
MNPATSRAQQKKLTRWVPAVAATALLGVVIVAGVAGGSGDGDGDAATSSAGSLTSTPVTQPAPVATVATTAPIVKTQLTRTLGSGMAGDDVRQVQERLTQLGFATGGADGLYGDLTTMAVWAYEKLVMGVPRQQATGQVTPEMWDRMQDPIAIQPRRPDAQTARHTEIYLPEQVIAVFEGTRAVFVAHISSGDDQEWCDEVTISPGEYGNENGTEPLKKGECGLSWTPGGVFQYHRRVEGRRESALGGMLNPVYFNFGIAVHGAYQVPLHPASHGCIRIANALSETFYNTVSIGELVYVWDGEKEPEMYGQQKPRFNWPDPDYTTTTTSTTTTSTTTTTTVPPTTTKPAPTTVAPTVPPTAATTTVAPPPQP